MTFGGRAGDAYGAHVNLLNSFAGEIRFHIHTYLCTYIRARGDFNYSLTDARVRLPVPPPPPQIELPYAFNLPTEMQNNLRACNAIIYECNKQISRVQVVEFIARLHRFHGITRAADVDDLAGGRW
jgi:hypothetical protein